MRFVPRLNAFQVSSNASIVPMVGVIATLVLLIVTFCMGAYSLTMAARNVTAIEEMFSGDNPYSYRCLL